MSRIVYLVNTTENELIKSDLMKLGLKVVQETSDERNNLSLIGLSDLIYIHNPHNNNHGLIDKYLKLASNFDKIIFFRWSPLEFNETYIDTAFQT